MEKIIRLKKSKEEDDLFRKLRKQTALSRNEILQIYWAHGALPSLHESMFVGGVGIKSYIPSKYRHLVQPPPTDLDVAIKDARIFPESRKDKLIDIVDYKTNSISVQYSPFEVYHISVPALRIGNLELREIDAFDFSTGIGPISITDEDLERKISYELFQVAPLYLQISTHLNPETLSENRTKKVLLTLTKQLDNECFELLENKYKDSMGVVKKVGLSTLRYKDGFKRASNQLKGLSRRYEKKIGSETNLKENLERLINTLSKMSETLPVT